MAQGSLAETDTLLTLCEEIGWFAVDDTALLRSWQDEVSRMLTTMRRRYRETR